MNNFQFHMCVLLVDDQEIVAKKISSILEKEYINVEYCKNPLHAIDVANEVNPTVILLDIMMPEISGLVLLKYLRANVKTEKVPIIMLSSKEEGKTKAEAFSLGANDYVVKIPDELELIARVRYHSQWYTHLLEKNAIYSALEENQKRLDNELRQAEKYVLSLLPREIDGDIVVKWKFIPSSELGGDIFGYHWIDGDKLSIYLLDVCGHGVGSALLSVSVFNILKSKQYLSEFSSNPAKILENLNDTFSERNDSQMFFTIWYGIVDVKNKSIVYSCGGHPPALIFNTSKKTVTELKTPGCAIAGIEGVKFSNDEIELNNDDVLYIYSDGAYELEDPQGKFMNIQQFSNIVSNVQYSNSENKLEEIIGLLRKYTEKEFFDDDLSIVKVNFKLQ